MRAYFKLLLALYFGALIVCLSCRVYLKLFFMNAATGLYAAGGDAAVTVAFFNAFLAAAPAAMFLSNRLLKPGDDYPVEMRDTLIRVFALAAGLAQAAFAVIGPPVSNLRQIHGPAFDQITLGIRYGLGGLAALALIFAAVFPRLCRKPAAALLLLFPTVWQIVYLVIRFNSYTTVASISDHLLLVLFMLFNALFLMGFARTLSLQTRRDGRNYAIPAGLCASLCGFLLVLPNYLYMLINKTGMPVLLLGRAESVAVLAMSALGLVFSLTLINSIKRV